MNVSAPWHADAVTDCLIIAAGDGSRLARHGPSKPLVRVDGTALIDRVMGTARQAGLRRFHLVTGHCADELERHVAQHVAGSGVDVHFVRNPRWDQPNGVSVRCAAAVLPQRFVLLMADHLFAPSLLTGALQAPPGDGQVVLAVDRRVVGHPTVDLDDVTRVLVEGDSLREIGKGLVRYNAFDTGVFVSTHAIFAALDASGRQGDLSLSGGIRVLASHGRVRTVDVADEVWIDVDDDRALALAARLFPMTRESAPLRQPAGT
jgi:choline kinase